MTSSVRAALRSIHNNAVVALSAIRLVPLIILMLFSSNRHTVWAGLDRWAAVTAFWHKPSYLTDRILLLLGRRILLFVKSMTWSPEYRNVFYLRTGRLG